MKKSLFLFIFLLLFLTTFNPNINFDNKNFFLIKKIDIENNFIISDEKILNKISYLYDKNLFFLNKEELKTQMNSITFIKSFNIKKIYPNNIRVVITEEKPVAILHYKRKKFYITDKGKLIKFQTLENYKNLPSVFGGEKNFSEFYLNLKKVKFPLTKIRNFYFFESERWDLELHDGKMIKLPNKDYLRSIENFMTTSINDKVNTFKIFDYRIQNQLILN